MGYKGLKSPLKWAGGKSWFVPYMEKIVESAPQCDYFIDLFCGACAVPLGLGFETVVANDANHHLINFWRKVRSCHYWHSLVSLSYDRDTYYHNRGIFNEMVEGGYRNSTIMAGLFYYLNRSCFNGLWRVNKSGEFNVPFGRHKNVHYMTASELDEYAKAIARWSFHQLDFRHLIHPSGSFIYADPPYDIEGHKAYTSNGFEWYDQVCLAHKLARHDGPVVAHNAATKRIVDLYNKLDFDIYLLSERRAINSNPKGRGGSTCIVATRNLEVDHVFA